MKKTKQKIKLIITIGLASNLAYSQTPPTGIPPANNNNAQAGAAWYRGGNNPGGGAGTNNIFGTMWNSPIYTVTDGQTRSVLNGDLTTNIASVNHLINSH